METLCGLGLPELIILALLAFVVIGPERSRDVALQAGRFLRNVMSSQWWGEFNDVASALKDLPNTLVRMADIEEAQKEIQDTISDINRSASPGAVPRSGSSSKPTTPPPPDERDMIDDPWGIANATAQTTYTPSSPPPSEEPGGDVEQPEPAEDRGTDES